MLSHDHEGCLGVSFHHNCNKSCIGWFKALRGCLIGPKTWDRIIGKCLGIFGLAVTVQNFGGLFGWK